MSDEVSSAEARRARRHPVWPTDDGPGTAGAGESRPLGEGALAASDAQGRSPAGDGLDGGAGTTAAPSRTAASAPQTLPDVPPRRTGHPVLWVIGAVVLIVIAYLILD